MLNNIGNLYEYVQIYLGNFPMLEKGPMTILLGGQELIRYIEELNETEPKSGAGKKYITNTIVCLWCGLFNLILGITIIL